MNNINKIKLLKIKNELNKIKLENEILDENVYKMYKAGSKLIGGNVRNATNKLLYKNAQSRLKRAIRNLKKRKEINKMDEQDFLKKKDQLKKEFKENLKKTLSKDGVKAGYERVKRNPKKSTVAGIGTYVVGKNILNKKKQKEIEEQKNRNILQKSKDFSKRVFGT